MYIRKSIPWKKNVLLNHAFIPIQFDDHIQTWLSVGLIIVGVSLKYNQE